MLYAGGTESQKTCGRTLNVLLRARHDGTAEASTIV